CKIHRIDRGEGHFCDTVIMCIGIVHTLYFSVNLSYYFNFKSLLFLMMGFCGRQTLLLTFQGLAKGGIFSTKSSYEAQILNLAQMFSTKHISLPFAKHLLGTVGRNRSLHSIIKD